MEFLGAPEDAEVERYVAGLEKERDALAARVAELEKEAIIAGPSVVHVSDGVPEEGAACLYWFSGSWWVGKYLGIENGLHGFGGKAGWLFGDVEYWAHLPSSPDADGGKS